MSERVIITREKFIEATGREPEQDDLERVNCPYAGGLMHSCCGWNDLLDCPQFEVEPRYVPVFAPRTLSPNEEEH